MPNVNFRVPAETLTRWDAHVDLETPARVIRNRTDLIIGAVDHYIALRLEQLRVIESTANPLGRPPRK